MSYMEQLARAERDYRLHRLAQEQQLLQHRANLRAKRARRLRGRRQALVAAAARRLRPKARWRAAVG